MTERAETESTQFLNKNKSAYVLGSSDIVALNQQESLQVFLQRVKRIGPEDPLEESPFTVTTGLDAPEPIDEFDAFVADLCQPQPAPVPNPVQQLK